MSRSSSANEAQSDTWRVLIVTLAIQALVSMAVLTVPAVAPAFAAESGFPVSLLGYYVGIVYIGAIMASLLSGQAVRRFGAIRLSQLGLILCMAGLLCVTLPSPWAVAAGAFLIGLGYGPITPASSHLLAISTPPHRVALVFSIKQTGVPLGGMLAGAVAPPIAALGGSKAAISVVALACLVCAFFGQPLRHTHDADRVPGSPLRVGQLLLPLRMVLRQRNLRRLVGTSFVFSGVQLCLAGYLVTYLNTELDYSLITAGVVLSVAQLGGILGRIFWGWVADRYLGATKTLMALALTIASGAMITALLPAEAPLWLVFVLMGCFGASATGWNGVYLAAVARRAPPGMAGAATGGALSVTFMGTIVVPAVFGTVSQLMGGFSAGYLALGVPVLLCGVMLWGDIKLERRESSA